MEDYPTLPLLCTNDIYLMNEFVKVEYSNISPCWLNYVQKHLKVLSLADISTIDGKSISWMAYLGPDGNGLRLDLDWSAAPLALLPTFVELWQEALWVCFGEFLCGQHNQRLPPHCWLGSWFIPNVEDKWMFFAPQEDRLYKQAGHLWNVYPASQPRPCGRSIYEHNLDIYFPFQSSVQELPPNSTHLASCFPQGGNRFWVCLESSVVSLTLSFTVPSTDLEFP